MPSRGCHVLGGGGTSRPGWRQRAPSKIHALFSSYQNSLSDKAVVSFQSFVICNDEKKKWEGPLVFAFSLYLVNTDRWVVFFSLIIRVQEESEALEERRWIQAFSNVSISPLSMLMLNDEIKGFAWIMLWALNLFFPGGCWAARWQRGQGASRSICPERVFRTEALKQERPESTQC